MSNTHTTENVIRNLKKTLSLIKNGKGFGRAVSSVHSLMAERIFEKGENITGAHYGQYDTSTPLYVNPATASPKKFPTKGKNGKSKFKDGTSHKTGYFDSYKDFRAKIKRETGFVNLRLFGLLYSDFLSSLQKENSGKWISGLKRKTNIGKLEGAEDRYGNNIFRVSKFERKELIRILEFELSKEKK